MKNCRWKCGGKTKNRTGICDTCWRNREAMRCPQGKRGGCREEANERYQESGTGPCESGKTTEAIARHEQFSALKRLAGCQAFDLSQNRQFYNERHSAKDS